MPMRCVKRAPEMPAGRLAPRGGGSAPIRLAAVWLAVLFVLPAQAELPVPETHFGHVMGADRELVSWAEVLSYFRALDAASESVLVDELGPTTEGRPMILAAIASPETIADLERYRRIVGRLADPRGTPPEEAAELAVQGKPVVVITCSIHSSEVASTMTAVQFAYDLLTDDSPRHRAILANTIFLLVPSLNPDGVDKVHAWYNRWLGTPHEAAPLTELYHHYTGHDNNRDWYIFSQQETRLTVEKVHNAWHPQIVYDVHQMGRYGARIFVPPWIDPVDPNIDPLIVQQVNAFGTAMAVDLTAAGRKGVLIHGIYDYYSPARHYQSYHGAMRLLSESASVRFASPVVVPPDRLDRKGRGYDAKVRSWNFLEPWEGGEWRLADIVEDQLLTFESVLYSAALRRSDLLRNFYELGRRAIERGKGQAWLVPARQHDPNAAARLLETLRFGGVEIERVVGPEPEEADSVRPGDYLVQLSQPYGAFAKTLLERQDYPDLRVYPGGPPLRPYDATAHSLPLLMGVEAGPAVGQPAVETEPAVTFDFGGGRVADAANLRLSPSPSASWIAVNRLLSDGISVHRSLLDGAFVLSAPPAVRERIEELAKELAIDFEASETPASNHPPMRMPRVAIYSGHVPLMDGGWTRWLLDRYEMPYRTVGNDEILAGLREQSDVLIIPDAGPHVLHEGFDRLYADEISAVPPAYRGGIGDAGVAQIVQFARAGGTVLAFNRAAAYAAERLDLPVENVTAQLGKSRFYGPGTLVNVEADPLHPLCFGMRETQAVWFESGPAFRVRRGASSRVRQVLRYPERNLLASGWLLGEAFLVGRAAVVDVSVGAGRVVLFGIRPQYRAQSDATFKMVFNGLYL